MLQTSELNPQVAQLQAHKMERYYNLHAKIYDATRWTFLFGRHWIIDWLPFGRTEKITVMEIGCGTGYNLKYLSHNYPKAKLVGYDLSKKMLDVASEKLRSVPNKVILRNEPYNIEETVPKADVILFSYCLTMVNPNWQELILQAKEDLKECGIIAVVDFHNSRFDLFKRWMGKNHVAMESHLLPFLKNNFQPKKHEIRRAYMGIWHYFLFVGVK